MQLGEPEQRIGKGDGDGVERAIRSIYPCLSTTRDHEVFSSREIHER